MASGDRGDSPSKVATAAMGRGCNNIFQIYNPGADFTKGLKLSPFFG